MKRPKFIITCPALSGGEAIRTFHDQLAACAYAVFMTQSGLYAGRVIEVLRYHGKKRVYRTGDK